MKTICTALALSIFFCPAEAAGVKSYPAGSGKTFKVVFEPKAEAKTDDPSEKPVTTIRLGSFSPAVSRGFSYRLPKTLIGAKVTYTIYQRLTWKDKSQAKIDKREYFYFIEKPIELSFPVVGDETAEFRVDTKSLSSLTVASITKFNLNSSMLLTGANSDFDDRTAEIAKGLTQTAANVAAIVVKSMANDAEKYSEVKKVGEYTEERGPFDLTDFEFKDSVIKILLTTAATDSALENIVSTVDSDVSTADIRKTSATVVLTPPMDPSKILDGQCLVDQYNSFRKNSSLLGRLPGAQLFFGDRAVKGIISRNPRSVLVTVNVGIAAPLEVYRQRHLFAQVGDAVVIPMNSSLFTRRKHELVFNEIGTAKTVGIETTSAGETFANMLRDMSGGLMPGISGIIDSTKSKQAK